MNQFLKYLLVGGINTTVCYILYLILLNYVSFNIAYALDYLFGIFFSYYLQLKLVFKEQSNKKKILLFPSTYIIQYLIGLAAINISVYYFHIPESIALLAAIIVPIPIMYFLSKKILTAKH